VALAERHSAVLRKFNCPCWRTIQDRREPCGPSAAPNLAAPDKPAVPSVNNAHASVVVFLVCCHAVSPLA